MPSSGDYLSQVLSTIRRPSKGRCFVPKVNQNRHSCEEKMSLRFAHSPALPPPEKRPFPSFPPAAIAPKHNRSSRPGSPRQARVRLFPGIQAVPVDRYLPSRASRPPERGVVPALRVERPRPPRGHRPLRLKGRDVRHRVGLLRPVVRPQLGARSRAVDHCALGDTSGGIFGGEVRVRVLRDLVLPVCSARQPGSCRVHGSGGARASAGCGHEDVGHDVCVARGPLRERRFLAMVKTICRRCLLARGM